MEFGKRLKEKITGLTRSTGLRPSLSAQAKTDALLQLPSLTPTRSRASDLDRAGFSTALVRTLTQVGVPVDALLARRTPSALPTRFPSPHQSATFSTTARNFNFETDLMLGAADSYKTHCAVIEHQASTDVPLYPLLQLYGEEAASTAFTDAFQRHTGKAFTEADRGRGGWISFDMADMATLKDKGFVAYILMAAEKVRQRGGKVFFSLGDWSARQYFADSSSVELLHGQRFADYLMGAACVPPLQGRHPTITNLEFGCLMETAQGQGIEVRFLDNQGDAIDVHALRKAVAVAIELTRSAANQKTLKDWQQSPAALQAVSADKAAGSTAGSGIQRDHPGYAFDAQATEAVRAVQALIDGRAAPH